MEGIEGAPTISTEGGSAEPTGTDIVNERKSKRPLSASSSSSDSTERKRRHEDELNNALGTTHIDGETQTTQASDLKSSQVNEDPSKERVISVSSTSTIEDNEMQASDDLNTTETFAADDEETNALLYKLFKMSDASQISKDAYKNPDISLPITTLVKTLFSPDNPKLKSRENKQTIAPHVASVLNENNQFLRSMTTKLDNMNAILKCNTDEITSLSDRVEHVEAFTDKSITQIDGKMNTFDGSKSELTKLIGNTYAYVDEKFGSLKLAIPETLAEISQEFEGKFTTYKGEVVLAVSTEVAKIPAATHLQQQVRTRLETKFDQLFSQKLAEVDERLRRQKGEVTKTINEQIANITGKADFRAQIEKDLGLKIERKFNEKLNEIEKRNSTQITEMRTGLNSLLEREKVRDDRIDRLEKTFEEEIML